MKAVPTPPTGAIIIDETLSEEAQGVMREVLLTHDLVGPSAVILAQVVALVEMAVQLDEISKERGMTSITDRGAPTVAGWVTQAAACRRDAANLLMRMLPKEGAESAYDKKSRAGKAGMDSRYGRS